MYVFQHTQGLCVNTTVHDESRSNKDTNCKKSINKSPSCLEVKDAHQAYQAENPQELCHICSTIWQWDAEDYISWHWVTEHFHQKSIRTIHNIFWPHSISNHDLHEKARDSPFSETVRVRWWRWIGQGLRTETEKETMTAELLSHSLKMREGIADQRLHRGSGF